MARTNKKYDIEAVGFGDATLDFLCIVNNLANYSQTTFIKDFKVSGGGSVATALVAFQRLGGNSAFIGSMGDDWIGKEIIKGLEKENIDCAGMQLYNHISSPFSFIQVSETSGKRAIAYHPKSRKYIKLDSKAKEIIKKAKILLIDGYTPKEDLRAAEFARSRGVKVMFDANILFEETPRLLKNTNYLITSKSFLYDYSNYKNLNFSLKKIYDNYKPEILVATLGEKGSVAVLNDKIIHVESFKIRIKDTTGAGDVYHGAFIFGILNKWKIKDIMIFSSAVSAIKCTKLGGRAGIPSFEATMDFLKKHKININKFRI